MPEGLDKDGGISFGRKLNYGKDKEEADSTKYGLADGTEQDEEEIEEPRQLDKAELLRKERLNAQLLKAKTINYSGMAFNGGSIIGLLFVVDNFIFDPTTLELLEMMFNKTLGLDIDFPNIIKLIQEYKMQLIGACMSFQTVLMSYKDICQKAKDRDCDSLYEVFNEEIGKVI